VWKDTLQALHLSGACSLICGRLQVARACPVRTPPQLTRQPRKACSTICGMFMLDKHFPEASAANPSNPGFRKRIVSLALQGIAPSSWEQQAHPNDASMLTQLMA